MYMKCDLFLLLILNCLNMVHLLEFVTNGQASCSYCLFFSF